MPKPNNATQRSSRRVVARTAVLAVQVGIVVVVVCIVLKSGGTAELGLQG